MSLEQKAGLQSLLQNFDSAKMSEDDAKALVGGIRELGIDSSRALGNALNRAGFEPAALVEKAGLLDETKALNDPGKGNSRGEVNNEAIQALSVLMDSYGGVDLTDDDWSEIFSDMKDKGIDLSQSLLDIRV